MPTHRAVAVLCRDERLDAHGYGDGSRGDWKPLRHWDHSEDADERPTPSHVMEAAEATARHKPGRRLGGDRINGGGWWYTECQHMPVDVEGEHCTLFGKIGPETHEVWGQALWDFWDHLEDAVTTLWP